MEAKSTDQKTFQLLENGQQIGKLIYENMLFLKAEIRLMNDECYELKPVGFFGTLISVTKDGAEIATLKMNWRGQVVLTYQDGQEFTVKAKGAFYNKFIVENNSAEKLVEFHAKYNWSKFQYDYGIPYDKKPQDTLFVLLGIYASNYFIASMSGATSGMA